MIEDRPKNLEVLEAMVIARGVGNGATTEQVYPYYYRCPFSKSIHIPMPIPTRYYEIIPILIPTGYCGYAGLICVYIEKNLLHSFCTHIQQSNSPYVSFTPSFEQHITSHQIHLKVANFKQ